MDLYADTKGKRSAVDHLWNSNSIQEGILTAIKEGALRIPVMPEELEVITNEKVVFGKRGEWEEEFASRYYPLADRLGEITNGFRSQGPGVDLLVYSCRDYVKKTFGDYDTGAVEWQEQNCPWDYDHILPKDWIDGKRECKRRARFLDVCRKMLWTIGNSAPVPFSVNRSKSRQAPGSNYPYGGEPPSSGENGLLVRVYDVEKYEEVGDFVAEGNEENIKHFVKTTAERMYRLYSSTYEDLRWREILKLGSGKDKRIRRVRDLCKEFPGARVFTELDDEELNLLDDRKSLLWFSPQLYMEMKGKDGDKVRMVYRTEDKEGEDGYICICPVGEKKSRIADKLKDLRNAKEYSGGDDEKVYLQTGVKYKEAEKKMKNLRRELRKMKLRGTGLLA